MSESSKYEVQRVFDEALSLFVQKNADYGDAWRRRGWRGNLGRIGEKCDRLMNTLWHSGPVGFAVPDEDARQTALDMINTLTFFVINWDQRREWGNEIPSEINEERVWRNRQEVPPAPQYPVEPDSALVTLTTEETRALMEPQPTPRRRPVQDNPQA